ncbi:MAG: hypothetical protein ACNYZI_05615 [Anaerolineales bacterium]
MPERLWILIAPLNETQLIPLRFWLLFAISILLVACAGPAPPTETIVRGEISAATLPPTRPSETPTLPEVEASPTNNSVDTLEDILVSYGLERWIPEGGDTSQNPITPDVLTNPATYGAFLDELDDRLKDAKLDVEKIASQGDRALVEVYWNGVSSYSEGTEVDIYYRGVDDPAASLWIRNDQGEFTLFEVGDLAPYIDTLPDEAPIEWTNPGRLSYFDDPWDNLANGLHIIDAEGRAIALWDRERGSIESWMKVSPHRYKIVNGMDVDYFGFSEDQLDVIWEALAWINLDEGNVKDLFEVVVSVRTTDLPAWIAGVAGRGDVRVDPTMFTFLRDNIDSPRQADVLWIAAILVHEAVHINQPGECSPQYAATQGMSFEEYGLFVETGPGQAYEQEVRFIERTLALKDSTGNRMVRDSQVREIIREVNEYYASVLGRAFFADGIPVTTCANP